MNTKSSKYDNSAKIMYFSFARCDVTFLNDNSESTQ